MDKNWHCGFAIDIKKAEKAIIARGLELFIPIGLKRPKKRRGKIAPPKNYYIFDKYIFWRGSGVTIDDWVLEITKSVLIQDEFISKIKADITNGCYDLGKKYNAELKKMIGSKIMYNNTAHPLHNQEIEIVNVDEQDNIIASVEIMGKNIKFKT